MRCCIAVNTCTQHSVQFVVLRHLQLCASSMELSGHRCLHRYGRVVNIVVNWPLTCHKSVQEATVKVV